MWATKANQFYMADPNKISGHQGPVWYYTMCTVISFLGKVALATTLLERTAGTCTVGTFWNRACVSSLG